MGRKRQTTLTTITTLKVSYSINLKVLSILSLDNHRCWGLFYEAPAPYPLCEDTCFDHSIPVANKAYNIEWVGFLHLNKNIRLLLQVSPSQKITKVGIGKFFDQPAMKSHDFRIMIERSVLFFHFDHNFLQFIKRGFIERI